MKIEEKLYKGIRTYYIGYVTIKDSKHLNITSINPKWQQGDSNPQPLTSYTNTQSFSQTDQMIELCCEYLSLRGIWRYVIIMSCGFTPKPVSDIIIKYRLMHRKDKFSQRSSIIWPVWLNDWVFVYELSGCGFVAVT